MINYLIRLVADIYCYCTDFVINVANITTLSYYEINAIIFCVLWPLITITLIFIYIIQRIRLKMQNLP